MRRGDPVYVFVILLDCRVAKAPRNDADALLTLLAGDGGGSTRHNEEAKSRRNYPVYVFVIFLDSDASLAMTEGGHDAYAMYVIKEFYDILS